MNTTRRTSIVGWSLILGATVVFGGAGGWLHWTNVVAERRADGERRELLAAWSAPSPVEPPDPAPLVQGEGFALLSIPRLRAKVWNLPVIHGVGDDELRSGIGHYPGSSRPGAVGNFALTGHRTAHGEPFTAFDELRPGDDVIVRTTEGRFVYTLVKDAIVKPDDVWVVSSDAAQVLDVTSESLISLVTCTPKWSTSHRWVWWGVLNESKDPVLPRR
jgi:sortase A